MYHDSGVIKIINEIKKLKKIAVQVIRKNLELCRILPVGRLALGEPGWLDGTVPIAGPPKRNTITI